MTWKAMLELAIVENELDRLLTDEEEEESPPSVEHLGLYGQLLHATHFFLSLLQSGVAFFKFR